MDSFRDSALWKTNLAPGDPDDTNARLRDRLRVSYEQMRERATSLAAEIARDLPAFTAHDIEHVDALWSVASLIAGDDLSLTPGEAYIFGGAVLLHDLGLAVAAYPDGIKTLRQGTDWADAVAMEAWLLFDRRPTVADLEDPAPELAQAATARVTSRSVV